MRLGPLAYPRGATGRGSGVSSCALWALCACPVPWPRGAEPAHACRERRAAAWLGRRIAPACRDPVPCGELPKTVHNFVAGLGKGTTRPLLCGA